MNLKEAIQSKTLELETALGLQKPHEELLKIYKELKELQYKKVPGGSAGCSDQFKKN